MIINDWLQKATARLEEAGIASPKLDSELILAHTLGTSRTWLVAHGDDELADAKLIHRANTLLTKRVHRVPLAYLTGHKEFYGRDFIVNGNVLIPRPETEVMIDLFGAYSPHGRTIDVGCGSGCIGITAKLEYPELEMTLSDISQEALDVAKNNAAELNADVALVQSDLLSGVDGTFDCILANLPYVDQSWERSPETNHEPASALFADTRGLALIDQLITQTNIHLSAGGYIFLEADPEQHAAIRKTGALHGLRLIETADYIVVLQRA